MEENIPVGNLVKPDDIDQEVWDQYTGVKEMTDPFLRAYDRGRQGKSVGVGNGLDRVNQYIHGTHAGRYYLIGADSGVGKTTITDYMYVVALYEDCKAIGKDLFIYYCSFEIGRDDKLARWTSIYLFRLFGLQLPSNYLLGYLKDKLVSDDHHLKILAAYSKVREMCKSIRLMDNISHPTEIFNAIVDMYEKYDGKVIRSEVTAADKKAGRKGKVLDYVANDDTVLRVLVLDHMALVGNEQKLDLKGLMDRMSMFNVILRNKFKMCIVVIQQFSTDLMSWQRTNKTNAKVLIPQRLDFGDSKTTFRDADIVMGYVKPVVYDYAVFEKFRIIGDYGPDCLGGYFIAQCIIKNRYGQSNRVLPIFLDPISSQMYDLPLEPQNVMVMQEWYDKAYQIDEICKVYSPKSG